MRLGQDLKGKMQRSQCMNTRLTVMICTYSTSVLNTLMHCSLRQYFQGTKFLTKVQERYQLVVGSLSVFVCVKWNHRLGKPRKKQTVINLGHIHQGNTSQPTKWGSVLESRDECQVNWLNEWQLITLDLGESFLEWESFDFTH